MKVVQVQRHFVDAKTQLMQKMEQLKTVPGLYDFAFANCFLAGGAVRDVIRNKAPKDYDMFFKTEAAKNEFIAKFGHFCKVAGFGNYNWEMFQFITLDTGSPKKVTDNFDWNVNMVWFDLGTSTLGGHLSINEWMFFNTKARTPLSAIMRIPHLVEKGFKIEQKELLFAYTFVSLTINLADSEVIKNQQNFISGNGGTLGGIEAVTERAVKAALENSPLMKALK